MKKLLISLLILLVTVTSLNAQPKRILVGSPIRQKPEILKEFLDSLDRLNQKNYILDYFFVDDNVDQESKVFLKKFSKKHKKRCLIYLPENEASQAEFLCDDNQHYWKEEIIWKVAGFKDQMIEHARENGYDYLFLVDSDIVLHPVTLDQLMLADKEIISNIFWTEWKPGTREEPQVWLYDEYTRFEHYREEILTNEEIQRRFHHFLDSLKKPGVHEVGGLGACTLIKRSALEKGVNFKEVKNLSFWGEDRHFCIRAAALDIPLFVDTHYPAYHIYLPKHLSGVTPFLEKCKKISASKITLSMVVKQDDHPYLHDALESIKDVISNAVIIMDGKSKRNVKICRNVLKGIPLKIVQNKTPRSADQEILRKQQWRETKKRNPEWILAIDADEVFESKFSQSVAKMLINPDVDAYYFPVYDFWNENKYREDKDWQGQYHRFPYLVRYSPEIKEIWEPSSAFCGRFPSSISLLSRDYSTLRLKNYAFATKEKREKTYQLWEKYKVKHRESLLDSDPNLITWVEQ